MDGLCFLSSLKYKAIGIIGNNSENKLDPIVLQIDYVFGERIA